MFDLENQNWPTTTKQTSTEITSKTQPKKINFLIGSEEKHPSITQN